MNYKEITWSLRFCFRDGDEAYYDIIVDPCHAGMFDGQSAQVGDLFHDIGKQEYHVTFCGFYRKNTENVVFSTFETATRYINRIVHEEANK